MLVISMDALGFFGFAARVPILCLPAALWKRARKNEGLKEAADVGGEPGYFVARNADLAMLMVGALASLVKHRNERSELLGDSSATRLPQKSKGFAFQLATNRKSPPATTSHH